MPELECRAVSLSPDSQFSRPATELIYGALGGVEDVTTEDIVSLGTRGTDCFVLTDGVEPLAAGVVMEYDDGVAVLEYIAVAVRHRRHGCGRRILSYIEETLAERGTERIEVNPLAQSVPFFERCSYEEHDDDSRGVMFKVISGK